MLEITHYSSLLLARKQPLNAILGMLELVCRGSSSLEEAQQWAAEGLKAGKLLTRLIEDTLDVTRLEQGCVALEMGRVSMPALARECLGMVRQSAREDKNIELQLSIDPLVEAAGDCLGDERRLQQVVLNLLTNAVRRSSQCLAWSAHLMG